MQSIARNFERIAFVASDVPEAQEARERLAKAYGNVEPQHAEAIVALGGDGLMLQTLHRHLNDRVPIYGMNRGSTGFLMNDYSEDDLRGRLARAEVNVIHPLAMRAVDAEGREHEALAINEVSLFRQIYQAAKIRISIDDRVRLGELICDGVLVATPAGSTADHAETRSVTRVDVMQASHIDLFMMFDPGHSLDERILSEQFWY